MRAAIFSDQCLDARELEGLDGQAHHRGGEGGARVFWWLSLGLRLDLRSRRRHVRAGPARWGFQLGYCLHLVSGWELDERTFRVIVRSSGGVARRRSAPAASEPSGASPRPDRELSASRIVTRCRPALQSTFLASSSRSRNGMDKPHCRARDQRCCGIRPVYVSRTSCKRFDHRCRRPATRAECPRILASLRCPGTPGLRKPLVLKPVKGVPSPRDRGDFGRVPSCCPGF